MRNYVKLMRSDRRGEVLVLDLFGVQMFSINENELSPAALEDEELLMNEVIENYGEVIEDMLSQKPYYNKIININDADYGSLFEVSIHNYDNEVFYVFAYDEQQALEILVGNLANKGEVGHFYTPEELNELGEDEDNFIYVDASEHTDSGNHLFYLSVEHTHIKKYNN